MKKILLSLVTIGVVSVAGFAVTQAFFSDTEVNEDNTINAGTIDIDLGESQTLPVNINDMKPSYVRWTKHVVRNIGTNPVKLWKHIKDIQTDENNITEPEQTWYDENGGPKNDIDTAIVYDMYVGGIVVGDEVTEENNWYGGHNEGGQVIIDEADGITLHDIESVFVDLGEIAPNEEITVWQSYHMKDETGNWAQSDQLTFDIEFYAEQVNGTGPIAGGIGPQTLLLENKDTSWDPIIGDGKWGVLKWAGDGATFDFSTTLKAHGLTPNTNYALVYAPDPWPQGLPGNQSTELNTGLSDSDGDLTITGNPNLGYDLPHLDDANYPTGAKIWLVLADDHDGTEMTGWIPSEYLFEYNLIKYDDTDAP